MGSRSAPGAPSGTTGCFGATGWIRGYAAPAAGRASLSPLLGQNAIARSACAVIVSDGFTPRLARDRRAVRDVQAVVAVDAVVRVDDPGLGAVADGAAADEVRGQRHVERLADRAAGRAASSGRHPPDRLVRDRDPGRVRLAVALLDVSRTSRAGVFLRLGGDRVVHGLHDQRDHGPLGPVLDVVEVEDVALLAAPAPAARSSSAVGPVAVGQHGLQQRHRVAALAVADRLDVGDARRGATTR